MTESAYERRQRQAAQRMLRQAMPDLSRLMAEITRQQAPIIDIARLYSKQHSDMVSAISKILPKIDPLAGIIPKMPPLVALDLPKIPALKLDYSSLFPDFSAISTKALSSLIPSIQLIQDLQRQQFAEIIANARAAFQASLPPNWRGKDVHLPSDLEALLLDEGLALAWVPPQPILRSLFAAQNAGGRRKIIGDRWKTITKACLAELDSIESADLVEHVEFARDAGQALLEGRPRPAQALSANLLDTILRQKFDSNDRTAITGRKKRLDIDEYPLRVAIVLGGIWGSFGEFWTSNGDKIPREYTRHASAHGVSRRQYSRVNSVLALMHVVSLLKLLDTDLKKES